MEQLRVVIADDEPIARDILTGFIEKVPGLVLAGSCKNAVEVFELLAKTETDLLLLDINMPEISGVELLKTLRNPPMVIFTTAYSEYAVESYELHAIDYLLKPIPFDRFTRAINKAFDKAAQKEKPQSAPADTTVFVKSDGKLVKIDLTEVLYVEGMKDYLKIWLKDSHIIIHNTLKNMEDLLDKYSDFLRVNRSYIVNLSKVNAIEGNMLHLDGHTLVIGNTYKEKVMSVFDKYRLD